MGIDQNFSAGFRRLLDKASVPCRIRYFTTLQDDVYDDAGTLVVSGNDFWFSAIHNSLDKKEGSTDSNLVEQGKLRTTDTKLYMNGSIVLTGDVNQFKVQVGSPTGDQYSLIPAGGVDQDVNSVTIYKCAYVRRLTNGSLIGE